MIPHSASNRARICKEFCPTVVESDSTALADAWVACPGDVKTAVDIDIDINSEFERSFPDDIANRFKGSSMLPTVLFEVPLGELRTIVRVSCREAYNGKKSRDHNFCLHRIVWMHLFVRCYYYYCILFVRCY
jgi:hypothetical protein